MSENETITRKALGRTAELGSLYDTRKDQLCGITLFKSKLPKEIITSTDMPDTNYEFDLLDSYEKKFIKLDVQGELKVSVLAGLCKLEGSGKYLSDQKQSKKSVKGSVIYKITTKEENFSISSDGIKELINSNSLDMPDATHVVVGITWGANVVASFEYNNNDNQSKEEIEGTLEATMRKGVIKISGSASVHFYKAEIDLQKNVSIKFFGDVLAQDKELPQTFDAALELMKKIPQYVLKYNNGKGSPLEYKLIPLEQVKKFFKIGQKVDRLMTRINSETIEDSEKVFDQFASAKQDFNDYYEEVISHRDFISQSDINQIESKKREISIGEAKLREQIRTALVKVRSGLEDCNAIEKILVDFQTMPYSPSSIAIFIARHFLIRNRIQRIRLAEKQNVKFMSKKVSAETLKTENPTKKIFIFYANQDLENQNPVMYKQAYDFFIDLSFNEDHTDALFYIIDYDVHEEVKCKREIKVEYYRNRKLVSGDYYAEMKESISWCLAKSPKISKYISKPPGSKPMEMKCPGPECSNKSYLWMCEKCKQKIEYGFDNNFYCECGGAHVESYLMKCTDRYHPNEYLKFSRELLKEYNAPIQVYIFSF
jgi:hypothetical protein